jgi:hypothetical protein
MGDEAVVRLVESWDRMMDDGMVDMRVEQLGKKMVA